MKINISTQNFQARNPNIRQADRICRMVNTTAPSLSPSRIMGEALLHQNAKIYNIAKILQKKLEKIVRDPGFNYADKNNNPEFYKFFVSALKKAKVANCGEKARLASLICAVNGIESQIASLWSVTKNLSLDQDLDHAILIITPSNERFNCNILQNMNDKIIIDPWFGIADYGNNIIPEYKKYFERFKNVDKKLENIDEMNYAVFSKETISNKNTEILRKIFPEFIIDKK